MIALTRFNGSTFYLNEDFIQVVEETPDTVITMMDGARYVVQESAYEIADLITSFRAAIIYKAEMPITNNTLGWAAQQENPNHVLKVEEDELHG